MKAEDDRWRSKTLTAGLMVDLLRELGEARLARRIQHYAQVQVSEEDAAEQDKIVTPFDELRAKGLQ